jgi:hypothetical protein
MPANCHPERSFRFAKRTGNTVEGSLLLSASVCGGISDSSQRVTSSSILFFIVLGRVKWCPKRDLFSQRFSQLPATVIGVQLFPRHRGHLPFYHLCSRSAAKLNGRLLSLSSVCFIGYLLPEPISRPTSSLIGDYTQNPCSGHFGILRSR